MKRLMILSGLLLSLFLAAFAVTCTVKAPAGNSSLPTPPEAPLSSASTTGNLPLRTLRDVPLTGGASRFDYQSFDPNSGRLYIAHLGDGMMTVFDNNTVTVVGDVKGLPRVHGVLAVPELHRVYASATGSNELAVIDDKTLQIITRVPA